MKRAVIFMCLTSLLLLFCACNKKESSLSPATVAPTLQVEPMSEAEISWVEAAFAVMLEKDGGMEINPLNCFLTSCYDRVDEIDMQAFLRYFPGAQSGSEAEFEALKVLPGWPFRDISMADMPVPLSRYPAQAVRDTLEKYAGLRLEDVDIRAERGVYYLAEYDAFYNYTSDFGLEMPDYYRGERQGDVLRLYEDHFFYGKRVLTLRETDDGYFVLAHQLMED